MDEHRQWFKSEISLGVPEKPLDPSICVHSILKEEMFVIPDTLLDPRFIHHPLLRFGPAPQLFRGRRAHRGRQAAARHALYSGLREVGVALAG
jgi:hypothetical protein